MKIGIVGLPNIGKSTLFNALTKTYAADAQNFPFCTIDPNVGIVDVRDPRVDALADLSHSKKKVYATIEFVDIAGLVRGAGKGEGLGNKFLSHIREVDAIVHVLRCFHDADVVHVEGPVDPVRDAEIINDELVFADLQQLERKIAPLQKKAQVTGDKILKKEADLLQKVYDVLLEGKMANTLNFSDADKKLIKAYNLLTIKPMVYALNVGQDELNEAQSLREEYSVKLSAPAAIVCAKMESELMDLDGVEKNEFVKELLELEHIDHVPTLDDLIALAFDTVGLMYYFTTGEKETKAWTVKQGSTAPQAAGVIHTDFERGFIKAEIVSYAALVEAGSWSLAKEKGQVRLEGKEYVVSDGDVIVFKFNV